MVLIRSLAVLSYSRPCDVVMWLSTSQTSPREPPDSQTVATPSGVKPSLSLTTVPTATVKVDETMVSPVSNRAVQFTS